MIQTTLVNKSHFLLLLPFLLSCSIDRTIDLVSDAEHARYIQFQKMPSESVLKITDEKEPGEKLHLCLTFVDMEGGATLPDQAVHFYHTSTTGNYEPANPADESTARLNGRATTDQQGRIYVETILPGDYGSSADNRHIHTTVFGAHPEAYDIHFKQYTGYMGTRFNNSSDQHFLADLKRTKNNQLVSFVTIAVKRPNFATQ